MLLSRLSNDGKTANQRGSIRRRTPQRFGQQIDLCDRVLFYRETILQTRAQHGKLAEKCSIESVRRIRKLGDDAEGLFDRRPLGRMFSQSFGQSQDDSLSPSAPTESGFPASRTWLSTQAWNALGPSAQFRFRIASVLLLQSLSDVSHSSERGRSTP